MGTITHLLTRHDAGTCLETSPAGRPCVEAWGHEVQGLSHMDALGFEWADAGNLGTYTSNPAYQTAQAS